MASRVVTVNDVLDGHVGLDLECFDRIYLNGWVPNLQVPGQVVNFRKAVTEFARDNDIEVIRFAKGERKLEVMRPHLDRLAREGRTGVAVIGVAQEFQRVFTGTTYHADADGGGAPRFGYAKADRRVTAYYFYLVDEVFGPAFVKICAYFPYPIKIWLNGHEYAKRAASAAGIGFTELDNGFAATDDPAGLQRLCEGLGPTPTGPAGIGGTSPCARSRSRAPSCSTARTRLGGSSRRCAPTTSTSAARNRCRSSSVAGSAPHPRRAIGRGCCARVTRSPSTPTSSTRG
jgi:hypothetical protein